MSSPRFSRRAFLTAGLALPAACTLKPSLIGSEFYAPARARAPEQVNLFSTASLPLGIVPARFVAAMQRYVDEYLFPVWGVRAQLRWSSDAVKGSMNLMIRDSLDVDGAIAYHNFDSEVTTTPYGEIGLIESYEEGTKELGVPVSHELGEMLVNPGVNMFAGVGPWFGTEDPPSALRAYEIADPVERTWFEIDGVRMSNFVYPAYFEPWRDGPLDFLQLVNKPGDILPGGYQLIRDHEETHSVVNRPQGDNMCFRVKAALSARPRTPSK